MAKLLLDGKKVWVWLLLLVTLLGNGCATTGDTGSVATNSQPVSATTPVNPSEDVELRVGDLVVITFQNAPDLTTHEERIKEDGSITLKWIGAVKAAGKTRGQLQKGIQEAYVPKYYPNLVATIKAEERYFFVGGDVKLPNRYVYAGQQTVLNSIATAGGFTEFAAKTRVQLTRADGKKFTINCDKAEKKAELDLPVYPGDRIFVPRKVI